MRIIGFVDLIKQPNSTRVYDQNVPKRVCFVISDIEFQEFIWNLVSYIEENFINTDKQ